MLRYRVVLIKGDRRLSSGTLHTSYDDAQRRAQQSNDRQMNRLGRYVVETFQGGTMDEYANRYTFDTYEAAHDAAVALAKAVNRDVAIRERATMPRFAIGLYSIIDGDYHRERITPAYAWNRK